MPLALTFEAVMRCDHDGLVTNVHRQSWVTVAGVPVLVDDDPEGRGIVACPNYGATIKPCVTTLAVAAGYSTFVRIDGRAVSLATVEGLTDGTPPGAVRYRVRDPGQGFVEVAR